MGKRICHGKGLKSLKVLKLRSLIIKASYFFGYFAETICQYSSLRSLILSDYKVVSADYDPQETLDMLGRIFQKSNLNHISLQEHWNGVTKYNSCKKFRLSEIEKQYPHIKTLRLPRYTHHFEPNREKWE